jgi:Stress responsive A/B Barrel Domain
LSSNQKILKEQTKMLTHIVIWKYRDDINEETREAHVEALRNLATMIPEVKSLQVGFDVLGLARSYDIGLVAIFEDRAGLEAYTVHPEHVKVADSGRSISAHVASVDFIN